MHTLKLYGPPGAGKTHSGIGWMMDRLDEGYSPYGMAFVSFTNAACDVARSRIADRLNIYPDDLEYCATLHALCKRALGIQGKDWNAEQKLREFADSYDYDLLPSRKGNEEDLDETIQSSGMDAPLLNVWSFGRNRCITEPAAAWDAYCAYDPESAERLDYPKYLKLVSDYEGWKACSSRLDFTDLLLQAVERDVSVPVSCCAIDEAQDQTPLLWRAADCLFRRAKCSAILADDDQAVYSFQGADPMLFNERSAESVVLLEQSRRVPSRIADLALSVIAGNRNRTPKALLPVTPLIVEARANREPGPATQVELEGEARRVRSLQELDLHNDESWFLLVRNWRFVAEVVTHLEAEGLPYKVGAEKYYSPWQEKGPFRSVRSVYTLAAGGSIGMDDLLTLLDKTRSATKEVLGTWRHGAKVKLKQMSPSSTFALRDLYELGLTDWGLTCILKHDLSMLEGGLSGRDLDAYRAAQRRGTWGQAPRVLVSTIHGVKGAEADNVAAYMGCSAAPARNLEDVERREEEIRLAYVAITRARLRFFGVECGTSLPYEVFSV